MGFEMRGKVLFGVGLAVGYVFGTRAGRKRYEQLKSLAESLWQTQPVQNSVDAAKGFAMTYTGDAAEVVLDSLKKVVRIASKGAARAERAANETIDDIADSVHSGPVAATSDASAQPSKKKAPAKKSES
ncbi:MAG TPA: YtxH domain-containing protein [Microbacteriaceae bacterium]|nr:YtxH domain-containing protein [Microbacteriaceae bacterium]